MTIGTGLLVAKDLIALFLNKGILLPSGLFDQAKLDTIPEDLALVADIETVLKFYGVPVPDRIDKILQILPLAASLVH